MPIEHTISVQWGTGIRIYKEPINQSVENIFGIEDQNEIIYFEEGLNIPLLCHSGTIEIARTPIHNVMVDIGKIYEQESRQKVISADGTLSVSGSLGFDIDIYNAIQLINFLIKRRKSGFHIYGATDQNKPFIQRRVWWQNLTLTCSAESPLTGTISFVSNAKPMIDISDNYLVDSEENPKLPENFEDILTLGQNNEYDPPTHEEIFNNGDLNKQNLGKKDSTNPNKEYFELIPYWQTGGDDIFSWNLSMNQQITPQFLNTTSDLPLYFRVGVWETLLEVETLRHPRETEEIMLGLDNVIKMTGNIKMSHAINYATLNDAGRYTFTLISQGEPTPIEINNNSDYPNQDPDQKITTGYENLTGELLTAPFTNSVEIENREV